MGRKEYFGLKGEKKAEIDENQEPDACYKDGILIVSFPRAKHQGVKRISIRK